MKTLLALSFTGLVLGCTSVKITAPEERDTVKSRVFSVSFESAWQRAVEWYADNNIVIDKIEKSSGLITAKYTLKADRKLMDCGDIKVARTWGDYSLEKDASLNLTVREQGPNSTRVNVNFFGEYTLRYNDAWDASNRIIEKSGVCQSTGRLERSVLDYVGG